MNELIELFQELRDDIDSVPYAHEAECNKLVGDLREESAR